jgi:hypothetical protein
MSQSCIPTVGNTTRRPRYGIKVGTGRCNKEADDGSLKLELGPSSKGCWPPKSLKGFCATSTPTACYKVESNTSNPQRPVLPPISNMVIPSSIGPVARLVEPSESNSKAIPSKFLLADNSRIIPNCLLPSDVNQGGTSHIPGSTRSILTSVK